MKTIPLLSSLVAIVVLTLMLAGIEPPAKHAEATPSHVEAVETAAKVEPVVMAPVAEKPPEPVLTPRQEAMKQAGIPEADWATVEDIVSKESGWCATKWEGQYGACPAYHGVPSRGGYGMCQSTPARKMASMGEDWETSEIKQLQWCHEYVKGYGGWGYAKKFRDCLGKCYSPRTKGIEFKKTTWF